MNRGFHRTRGQSGAPVRGRARRRGWRFIPLAAALAVALGSGGLAASSSGGSTVLRIGFIVDLTGPLAPIGTGYARGVKVAEDVWNGSHKKLKVEINSCDSQSTGSGAIGCYLRLKSQVDAISGPSLFVGLASVRGIAANQKPPLVSGAPLVNPPPGSWMFQTIPTIDDAVAAALFYFKKKGYKRIATLTSNDQPGNLAKDAAPRYARRYGLTLVSVQVFDPQASDLTAQSENVVASKPDAILAWTAGPQVITALRGLNSAGNKAPVMLNYASMVTALLNAAGPAATSNLLFFGSRAFVPATIADKVYRKRVGIFSGRFMATFNQSPDLAAFDSADTIYILAAAALQGSTKSEQIRKALERGKPLPALLFPSYKFTPKRHVGAIGAAKFDILKWDSTGQRWTLVESPLS